MATDAVKRLRALLTMTTPDKMAMVSPYAASSYCAEIVRAAAAVCDHFAQHHDFYEGGHEVGNKCRDAILSALDPEGGDDD